MKIISTIDAVADRLLLPSFSTIGPRFRRRLFDWGPVDVASRTIAITGPTSGIGLMTARQLQKGGASLVLIARNESKANALQQELAEFGTTPEVVVADLGDLASIRNAASQLADTTLDGLIHNGGGLHAERQLSTDGIELTLATHVVAPFLLTALVLPALRRSVDSRVLTVASGGMYSKPINIEDLQSGHDYVGATAYAQAKRAQVVLSRLWAQRLANSPVSFHAMHPGWVRTPGITDALPTFSTLVGPILRTPEEGSDTIVWLCGADKDHLGSGQFWLDRRPRPTVYLPGTRTGALESVQLWERIADLAGLPAAGLPAASHRPSVE